jgi:intracellular sulfur oxidation DsrE/DsrF family protein
MRALLLSLLTTALFVPLSLAAGPELVYPRIKRYGGVVPLPKAAQKPRRGTKVVLDITADPRLDAVIPGLERAARLLNLYAAAGVPEDGIKVALVLHGEATKAALNDRAYASRFLTKTNPNLPLIRELKKAGVEVYVCGQALHSKGFPMNEVVREVPVALAALTVVINKQAEGYAYVPGP